MPMWASLFCYICFTYHITGFGGAAKAKTISDISATAMTTIAIFTITFLRFAAALRLRSFSIRAALFFLGLSAISVG